jgi:hypothetical protein
LVHRHFAAGTSQCKTLTDAESVLLIHNRQREARQRVALVDERMRADQQQGLARRRARQPLAACGRRRSRGQQPDGNVKRLEPPVQRAQMLFREQFGRRHQRGLKSGADRPRGGERRDDGLAAADIALQQPAHGMESGEIRGNCGDGSALRTGQPERQRRSEPLVQLRTPG